MTTDSFSLKKLGEVLDFKNGKSIKPGGDGKYPVYGSNGIIGGCNEYKERNGIIIGRVGAYCGSVSYCQGKFWASDNTIVAYPKTAEYDVLFLSYLLKELNLNRWAGGAAQPLLTQSVLKQVEALFPPPLTQRKTAAILSAYDELIENNLRRIKILEEMAQLIYREWFVHFRFPGHEKVKMVDSPLGKIPEGWEVSTISSICTSLQDGDWIETKDQGGNDYRLLQVSNIGVGKFIETGNYRYISNDTFHRLRCKEVVPGDILIARMPKPTGRAWLVTKMPWRMITAVDVAIAKPNYERVLPQYLLHHLNSYENLELIEKHQTGTTRPRISRSTLGSLQMLVPPINLQAYFNDFASLLYQLITCMHKRNTFLKETRDLLLPKLISGELDVSKLDIDTGRLDE